MKTLTRIIYAHERDGHSVEIVYNDGEDDKGIPIKPEMRCYLRLKKGDGILMSIRDAIDVLYLVNAMELPPVRGADEYLQKSIDSNLSISEKLDHMMRDGLRVYSLR